MGQKVNPVGLRVGINRTWDSRWFADGAEYGKLLHEDRAIREYIMKHQRQAGISKVVIERPHKKCRPEDQKSTRRNYRHSPIPDPALCHKQKNAGLKIG